VRCAALAKLKICCTFLGLTAASRPHAVAKVYFQWEQIGSGAANRFDKTCPGEQLKNFGPLVDKVIITYITYPITGNSSRPTPSQMKTNLDYSLSPKSRHTNSADPPDSGVDEPLNYRAPHHL
jgi:hypothetical protein